LSDRPLVGRDGQAAASQFARASSIRSIRAIKEVLERSQLYAFDVEPQARGGFNPAITVQTQVNMPEALFAAMSDADLEAYDKLLTELRELLPKDEPKRIGGVRR
jgi:hypothetical protein